MIVSTIKQKSKYAIILLVFFILILLASCTGNIIDSANTSGKLSSSTPKESASSPHSTEVIDVLTTTEQVEEPNSKYIIKKGLNLYDIRIDDTEYENMNIMFYCGGSIKGNDEEPEASYIFGKKGGQSYDPILAVMLNGKPLIFELDTCHTYNPLVYMKDIDGDGKDEVIVDSVRTAMGIGEYVLYIFKIEEGNLVELYRFPSISYDYGQDSGIPHEILNFGFKSRLFDNYQLFMEFPALNFNKTINLSYCDTDNIKHYYDDEEKLTNKIEMVDIIRFYCFQETHVEDIDGDGIYEIIGWQNADIYPFTNDRSIGAVKIVLKFNVSKQQMEVIEVDFREAD